MISTPNGKVVSLESYMQTSCNATNQMMFDWQSGTHSWQTNSSTSSIPEDYQDTTKLKIQEHNIAEWFTNEEGTIKVTPWAITVSYQTTFNLAGQISFNSTITNFTWQCLDVNSAICQDYDGTTLYWPPNQSIDVSSDALSYIASPYTFTLTASTNTKSYAASAVIYVYPISIQPIQFEVGVSTYLHNLNRPLMKLITIQNWCGKAHGMEDQNCGNYNYPGM
jgi:hypothetical protein